MGFFQDYTRFFGGFRWYSWDLYWILKFENFFLSNFYPFPPSRKFDGISFFLFSGFVVFFLLLKEDDVRSTNAKLCDGVLNFNYDGEGGRSERGAGTHKLRFSKKIVPYQFGIFKRAF